MSVLWGRGVVLGPLEGVDLELQAGLTVLTGEDGCGASLLLRVLAGQARPEAGDVGGGSCLLLQAPPGDEWSRDAVVTRALDADHLLGREMGSMSSGERQRVRLADALAQPADVLLLDEPTGHLDERGVRSLLAALRSDGRPALVVAKTSVLMVQAADLVLALQGGTLRVDPQGGLT